MMKNDQNWPRVSYSSQTVWAGLGTIGHFWPCLEFTKNHVALLHKL